MRGIKKGADGFGGTVFTQEKVIPLGNYEGYNPLLKQIINFYETGIEPVKREETLGVCKFIDAAYQSRVDGGNRIAINP